jgi:putative hydrolase of the HAD superfamily
VAVESRHAVAVVVRTAAVGCRTSHSHVTGDRFGRSTRRVYDLTSGDTSVNRYVVWDLAPLARRAGGWGGTLRSVLDRHAADVTATPAALETGLSGLPWDDPHAPHPDWSADRWWMRHQPVFAAAFASVGVKRRRADALAEHVREAYLEPDAWSLEPGALATLAELADRGWGHLLLTNDVPELPMILNTLGLASQFDATFVSATTGYEKPHERAFERLYEWADNGRFWLVGIDPERDRAGADRAGIPSVLVGSDSGYRTVEDVVDVPTLLPN